MIEEMSERHIDCKIHLSCLDISSLTASTEIEFLFEHLFSLAKGRSGQERIAATPEIIQHINEYLHTHRHSIYKSVVGGEGFETPDAESDISLDVMSIHASEGYLRTIEFIICFNELVPHSAIKEIKDRYVEQTDVRIKAVEEYLKSLDNGEYRNRVRGHATIFRLRRQDGKVKVTLKRQVTLDTAHGREGLLKLNELGIRDTHKKFSITPSSLRFEMITHQEI